MEEKELVDYVVRQLIEAEFMDAKIDDFHPYQQQLIKHFDFDIHNFNDIISLSVNCRVSLFVNFYADAQLTIFRKNMEYKYGRELSDKEAMEMAYKMKLRAWHKCYFYSLRRLDGYDRSRLYNDFGILRRIDQKNLLYKTDGVERILQSSESFDFRNVCDKYTTLYNLHNKYELLELGLEDFIDDVIPLIMDMPDACQNDLLFPFMIWKDEDRLSLKKKI